MSAEQARARLAAALVRLGAGDKAALEQVYRATSAKLFGICLRILGDRKEAEDTLQEVYLTLWRRADRFDPARASPITWIAVLARNRAIDRLRRKRTLGPAVPVEAAREVADETPSAEDSLIEDEGQARIHHCLETLESAQRSGIKEAFFGGFTYADLAQRAGIPLGTMKSRIRRGLARLKTCLEAGE
ncbi:sigma-70 family RNA polymerase sigma factor [Tsuneonella sp. YG55]|uniref:Sigma-70 family RNA polymerase sigma factor n=1 Tax=Tsuneonella litorea TaxID=2976475 RepID=A0A9X3A7X6_9SPHN|nr:sigma-70 family RNA polymerase sigma factor [Tsuneonella litorea]MCT2558886.1 sigma-70 family RNA polymerase sigma factor [Tsuneonella litorea]